MAAEHDDRWKIAQLTEIVAELSNMLVAHQFAFSQLKITNWSARAEVLADLKRAEASAERVIGLLLEMNEG